MDLIFKQQGKYLFFPSQKTITDIFFLAGKQQGVEAKATSSSYIINNLSRRWCGILFEIEARISLTSVLELPNTVTASLKYK